MVNSLVFKPLFLIISAIIAYLIFLKYHAFIAQRETIELNNRYYNFSEKYRSVKKRHPEIENVTSLADLYNLQTIINIQSPVPFELLKKLFSINNPAIEIINIDWYVEDEEFTNKNILATFNVLYSGPKKEIAIKTLYSYINEIKIAFHGYEVTYVIDYDNVVELPKMLTMPAAITINTKTSESINVR